MATATATATAACAVSFHTRTWRCRWQSRMSVVVAPQKSEAAIKVRSSSPVASTACELASIWRKIQGADDWAGLLEPLNPILRDEVVRYGELVTACYDAFDLDPASPRFLKCKHGKKRLLHETGLGSAGYEISRYIYATAPDILGDGGGRWIGYVAVVTDEVARRLGRRDVLVAFRGTVTKSEWAANLMSSLTPARLDPHGPRPEVMVESGFLTLYTNCDSQRRRFSHGSCREQLLKEVARLMKKHEAEEMSLTLAGHSMGSALALLLGYDLAELGLNWRAEAAVPITVYSYGGPRVGNWGFKERCDELAVKVLRVVNVRDPVTKLPGLFLNESLRRWGATASQCYAHVGVELALDFFEVKNPACVHDMGKYVALLKCRRSICQQQPAAAGGVDWVGKAAMLLKKKMEELPWRPDAALFRKVGNWVDHSHCSVNHFNCSSEINYKI